MGAEFTWIDAQGRDITATDAVLGYSLADYVPGIADLDEAADAELCAAYLGPDCDGIGVRWSVTA